MVAMRIAIAFLVSLFGVGCADLQLIQLTAHADAGACSTCFTVQVEVQKGLWGLGALKTVDEHKTYASGKLAGSISAVQARVGGTVTGKVGTAPGSGGTDEAFMYILVDGVALSSVTFPQKSLLEGDITALGSADNWNLATLNFVYASGDTSAGLTSDQAASGKGDPHLTNMHGQRFDLYQPGVHVLIQVPRRARPADTLLRVDADARRMGAACADLYFQVLNITGNWTGESGGLQFFANKAPDSSDWRKFGDVDLKVIRGHTGEGIEYLNVFVKHLNAVKFPVGGLLGEDDHAAAATPGPECTKGVDLHAQGASFAMIEE
jgi:hypothetical protein